MISDATYLEAPIEIEKELKDYFKNNQKLVVFDIGSCDGLDSVKYGRFFPDARIYAFEPVTSNFELIKNNIKKYGLTNISAHNVALSDKDGTAVFFVSSGQPEGEEHTDWDFGNKSSSLLPPEKTTEIHPWLKFEHQVEVNTEQLDSFCQNNSIQKIDLIHMDVQGAELMVLNGAEKMIPKIKMIWMEVGNLKLYKDQPLKTDVDSFMATHGFTKIKDTVSSIAGDQLWVNLSYFPRKRLTHNVWCLVEPLFTKKKKKVELSDAAFVKKSFAQCGEDLIVDYIFQAKGLKTYSHLDIGAHHPYKINNTYLSYTKGGRGINIEPNPTLFSLFKETRKEDINLNVGVAEMSAELEYFMVNDPALNTFSKDELSHILDKGYKLLNTIKVKVHNINQIIQNYFRDETPDVLFVDVEGLDLEIIRSLDFQKYRPKVICIETIAFETDGSGVKNDNLIQFILSKGYQLYADTNINSIFVLKDFWHR